MINDIKNKETARKSTIKEIKNVVSDLDEQRQKESTVFQNKMIDVFYYLFNSLRISRQPGRSMLLKWVKVSGKRFNEILRAFTKAKNDGLETNAGGRKITVDKAESLLKDLVYGKIDDREFKKEYSNIVNDANAILKKPMITRSQEKMVKALLQFTEILKPKDKHPDTTNMPELQEGEESAE